MLTGGLLGFGAIGNEHSAAIGATDGLTLVAVADPDPQRRDIASALTPGVRTFEDSQALLDSGAVDVIIVSTPPNSHARRARAALETTCMSSWKNPWRSQRMSAMTSLHSQKLAVARWSFTKTDGSTRTS